MNIISRVWKLFCSPCWFGHPNLLKVSIDGDLWLECERCLELVSKYPKGKVIKYGPMAIQKEIKGKPNCVVSREARPNRNKKLVVISRLRPELKNVRVRLR